MHVQCTCITLELKMTFCIILVSTDIRYSTARSGLLKLALNARTTCKAIINEQLDDKVYYYSLCERSPF